MLGAINTSHPVFRPIPNIATIHASSEFIRKSRSNAIAQIAILDDA